MIVKRWVSGNKSTLNSHAHGLESKVLEKGTKNPPCPVPGFYVNCIIYGSLLTIRLIIINCTGKSVCD